MTPPIFLLGEAQGENEAKINAGFVGASGAELLRMLDQAKILSLTSEDKSFLSKFWNTGDPRMLDCVWNLHPEVHRSNVFQAHPPANRIEWFCGPKAEAMKGYPALIKGKYVHASHLHHLERLRDELVDCNPNIVVCLGNSALWAMAGKTGVSKLRGTTLLSDHCCDGFKLLSTYHPAAVLRQWELRAVTVMDLIKVRNESPFPEIRRPQREIWIEPTLEDVERFYTEHILRSPLTAVDIETSGQRVTCIGFAPFVDLAIVIPFDDARAKGRSYWPNQASERKCWEIVRNILIDRRVRKVFQNGLYDIAFLWRSYGIPTYGAEEDSMLCHHALQPESLKGLGFLGSVYSNESAWKTERKIDTIKRED